MLRSATFHSCACFWCTQALAASEADRRNCTATGGRQGPDRGLHARPRRPGCAARPAHHGASQPRHRLRRQAPVRASPSLDFDEALKLEPAGRSGALVAAPARSAIRGQYDRAIADFTEVAAPQPAQRPRPQRARPHAPAQGRSRRPRRPTSKPPLLINPQQRACPQQSRPGARQADTSSTRPSPATARRCASTRTICWPTPTGRAPTKQRARSSWRCADFKQAAERKAPPKHEENARAQD